MTWGLIIIILFHTIVSCNARMKFSFQNKRNIREMNMIDKSQKSFPRENIEMEPVTEEYLSALYSSSNSYFPPCIANASELVYVRGALSATQTFLACTNNIPDPAMLPTYYNGSYHGITVVNSTMVVNNLEYVDEITGTARMQFTIRMYWKDDRFAMPAFWEATNRKDWSVGIDLTDLLLGQNVPVEIWFPLIRFPDATEVNILSQCLKLNASNIFYQAYAIDITLVQPKFNFESYPYDEQTVVIRYVSYNFNAQYVHMGFNGGLGLIFNQYLDGSDTFKSNQIWTFNAARFFPTIGNGYGYAVYEFDVTRQGSGIIIRLVLPIAFLLVLSALTFWVIYENRVDTTITILLSVSALYIVILGNIPMVGYLTDVDNFVFAMFLLLVGVIILHQVYATLKMKEDRWPLRAIILRLIETLGRVFILPFIVCYFVTLILASSDPSTANALLAVTIIACALVFIQEMFGLRSTVHRSINNLIAKVNNPSLTVNELNTVEIMVLNYLKFRKVSSSPYLIAQELAERGSISSYRQSISVKNLVQAKEFISPRGDGNKSTDERVNSARSPTIVAIGSNQFNSGANRSSMGAGGVELNSFQNNYNSGSFSNNNFNGISPLFNQMNDTEVGDTLSAGTKNRLANRIRRSISQHVDSDDEQ